MRRSIAFLTLAVLAAFNAAAAAPEAQLALGLRAFRAGDYSSALVDLQKAAETSLTTDDLQGFVTSGQLPNIQTFETALIYVTLAHFRLGHEDEARESILRLLAADHLVPVYETLPLEADAAEFETLAAALVPTAALPYNAQLASADPSRPLPSVRPALATAVRTPEEERAARQEAVDAFLVTERDRLQREIVARATIAAPPAEPPAPTAVIREVPVEPAEAPDAPVAAQSPAVPSPDPAALAAEEAEIRRRLAEAEADADRRVAEAERSARERIEAAAAAQRAAEERAARAERESLERAAAQRAATAEKPVAPAPATTTRALNADDRSNLIALRQAEAFATNGAVDAANEIYRRIATAAVPREILAEAAIGLYRTGSYRDAAQALARMGAFGRGEEDLRFYNAVTLYELGDFENARRELDCALPFIQINDEVARYKLRIEQTAALSAMTR